MLIFFDIDGTLIGEQSKVMLQSTKDAIQAARKNGHICLINTGRSRKLVVPEVTKLTEFDGLLLGCGTMVEYHGEVLFHKTFAVSEGEKIIAGLRKNRVDAVLEGSGNNYRDSQENVFSPVFAQFLKRFDKRGFESYEEAAGHFDKLYCYVEKPEYMSAFREEFEELLDFVDREQGFYELTPKGCSKASTMQFLAEKLGVPMEETAAIGDSNNDISMLTAAGHSIAMGNATAAVKELAEFVTTDADGDGIRNALKWLGVC